MTAPSEPTQTPPQTRAPTRWADWATVALYAVLLVVVGLAHEPWRDEADAWLVVRDNGLSGIFRLTPYMGTPALWYLVIFPFVKLGAPIGILQLVNGSAMIAAVAILVRCAPIPLAVRVLLPFTYLLSYEYGVIARSYGLSVLLLFGATALYRHRHRHPLPYFACLGLLLHTNVPGAILGGALLAISAVELVTLRRRPPFAGLALAGLLGVLALLQVLPLPLDVQLLFRPNLSVAQLLELSWRKPLLGDPGGALWTPIAFGLLGLVALRIRHSWRALAFLALSLGSLWLFLVFVFPGSIRHWGFLLLAVVVALWIDGVDGPPESTRSWDGRLAAWGLPLLLAVNVWGAADSWWKELRHPFSMARAVAEYIESEGLESAELVGHAPPTTSGILPYVRQQTLFYPALGTDGSHMLWNRAYSNSLRTPFRVIYRRILQRYPEGDPLIILNVRAFHPALELVHEAHDPNTIVPDENFYLYRLRGRGTR